jgi:hypothetical protein
MASPRCPDVVPSPEVGVALPVCGAEPGAVPPVLTPEVNAAPALLRVPRAGVPSLSTPSRAAEIRADPRVDASNLVWSVPVPSEELPAPAKLLNPRPCDTDVTGAAVEVVDDCSWATKGLLCCRLGA